MRRRASSKNLLLALACAALVWSMVLVVQQDSTPHFGVKLAAALAVIAFSAWPSIVPEARQYVYLILAWLCSIGALVMLENVRRGAYYWGMSAGFAAGAVLFAALTRNTLAAFGAIGLYLAARVIFFLVVRS
jgi:hypothetical protein